jgi:glycerol uptake facilitator-like aquaporin
MTSLLDTIATTVAMIPGQVWAALFGTLLVVSVVTLPLARRQARAAGARAAGRTFPGDRRDRALFLAALVPGFAFLVAVLAGSQRGLVAFGRDDLRWHHGWEFLVPATLDGVGLAFGFLAFRAVRRRRNPDRAVRVAWGAAIASAVINFGHESGLADGSSLAGAYLALLSLFVMVMFHELLAQFVEGTEYVVRVNPAFGLRWFTWPSNTACAWIAWRNWPPVEGTAATVGAAVAHLDDVRATKRATRQQRPHAPWWAPMAPWVRLRDLDAALAEQRSSHGAERAELAVQITRLEAEMETEQARGAARVATAERLAEQYQREAVRAAEQRAAEQAERLAVQAELDATERRRATAETVLLATVTAAERRTDQPEPATRVNGAAPKQPRSADAPNTPRLTDDEAVQAMLRAHPDAAYGWTKREVHRITGAGFGRVDRLIAAVAEHHRDAAEQSGGAAADNDKENAS